MEKTTTQHRKISCFERPGNSSDLNPIENLCATHQKSRYDFKTNKYQKTCLFYSETCSNRYRNNYVATPTKKRTC